MSTDQEDQIHSFDAQVAYYTKYIETHEKYEMAGIYADEGISGTNTKKRVEFKRMIADCEAEKIDMVITKSISRFARNTQDCLMYSRKLKNLGIGILFEKENINTMDSSGELLFTILSSLAQDESRNISENCKWGIRTKFKNGELHLNTFKFLGYDKDENGKLVINSEEAKTIRRIYREFLWGLNPQEIAKELEDDNVLGCLGQTKWYASTVLGILKNEKHMGDALLQKTYTADFLTKRQVKNQGEITQVYVKDSHKGIIDKETWNAVQEELERRKVFREKHGVKSYNYGAECNPFTNKLYCDLCGHVFGRHTWKTRGIAQWQCSNHRSDGKLTCKNEFVDVRNLEQGFVKAMNRITANREKYMKKWERMIEEGTPLQRVRANQMIEITAEPPLEAYVSELAQLTVIEVTVFGAKEFEFEFMDGSKIKI
ncbi:DNA invertase Pin-like site-specific DNA recombinase [Kineothrix alysoides]|uniref:DNA invertase Pin-like site-specific DNA recombinase n=1 Tax=Kineothrix alysoides TaxID=1469948 RepID=A0A4R1R4Z4_9FIRM|nr:DNA invertase Pin-like site-specific DNA recombinase [Kineothrix alysoides]